MTEVRADESYRVALPEFEGPLDLLLHLCKTHEIEIVNIPISFITEKYLEYLDMMQSLPVDVAADYLVMAATLAYLKSRELVPTPEAPEAAEEEGAEEVLDPREELIRRLLEYQKYKNAAALLGERPIEGRNIFGRGMEIETDGGLAPLADHSAWKLIEAFGKLLEKAGPKVTHNVIFDRVSISSRINQVIDRLEQRGGALRFDELFDLSLPEPELRSQLVVTLLAMLELARLRVVRVLASQDQETLIIAQVEGAALEEARRARFSSDAESVAAGEAAEEEAVEGLSIDAPATDAFADDASTTVAAVADALTQEPLAEDAFEEAFEALSEAPFEDVSGETFADEGPTTVAGEALIVEERVDDALAEDGTIEVTISGDELAEQAFAEEPPTAVASASLVEGAPPAGGATEAPEPVGAQDEAQAAFSEEAPTVVVEEVALSDSGAVVAEAEVAVRPNVAEASAEDPAAPVTEERHEET